jgi:alpha-N-acetylglucosaminidase
MKLRNMQTLFLFLLFTLVFWVHPTFGQVDTRASLDLIQRVIPANAGSFLVEGMAAVSGKDVFEIESRGDKIILRGSSGVAVASALYYYLTNYCHCQVTWNGVNLKLPSKLPTIAQKLRVESPYKYRYYLNYCTFNYSMSWWDWDRWQKEIDWMALHGINMPLALTGQEYTWYEVYKDMGFSDADLASFFCGPAYFSWFWMGNLDAWGGPLPLNWMLRHKELQQEILARERSLGMKPVLQSFTGHVPASFTKYFPASKLKKTNWTNGFADTYILDTEDPLFAQIGKKFLQAQTRLYGTDHLYSADTFNENLPPSNDSVYLDAMSGRVYQAMSQADPQAVWVMQGWLFYNERKFWQPTQVQALLNAVPNDHMIILDLATEISAVWKRTDAYYGKPWIWNMVNNFGGNINLFGRMDEVATGPASALHNPGSGQMEGIGLTMEGIEQNPVMYELMMENSWRSQPISLADWIPKYIRCRYGTQNDHLSSGWEVLHQTVYNGCCIRDGAESIITGRPTLDSSTVWTKTRLNYKAQDLLPAWDDFIQAIPSARGSDGFAFDLVDITRQVMADYALPLQRRWVNAYQQKNQAEFLRYSREFLDLISDMDSLLATRKDFLLGPWIHSARAWGKTEAEQAIYERNARDLVTLWGDRDSPLHEYACRQWSGLLNDFYRPRWAQFFTQLAKSLQSGSAADLQAFDQHIRGWEWRWVLQRSDYPLSAHGDPIRQVQQMYDKYRKRMQAAYE